MIVTYDCQNIFIIQFTELHSAEGGSLRKLWITWVAKDFIQKWDKRDCNFAKIRRLSSNNLLFILHRWKWMRWNQGLIWCSKRSIFLPKIQLMFEGLNPDTIGIWNWMKTSKFYRSRAVGRAIDKWTKVWGFESGCLWNWMNTSKNVVLWPVVVE